MKFNLLKLKKSSRQSNGLLRKLGNDPYTDWKFIFVVNVTVGLVGAAFAAYIFVKINNGDFKVVARKQNTSTEIISRDELDKLVGYYNDKAKNFEDIRSSRVYYLDPSY